MLEKIKPIAKAVVSFGGAVVITASIFASGNLDPTNITIIVTTWLTVLGVYQVPNKPVATV